MNVGIRGRLLLATPLFLYQIGSIWFAEARRKAERIAKKAAKEAEKGVKVAELAQLIADGGTVGGPESGKAKPGL